MVIANGIDAPALWPGLPVRPVKGEVLRLRWRKGCMPLPQRVIRARVHGRQVYLVPRADGVVVGATQYEHGRDTAPVVSGVRDLLDDACAVLPALGEYELAECAAGLRPMTPDNLPLVQRLDARTLVAAGHGRSGFLLAPWTAEQIVSELPGAPRSGVHSGDDRRWSTSRQVEVDDADHGRRAAAVAGFSGPRRRGGDGRRGVAAIPLDDKAFRRCPARGGDGGAGWLIPN